MNTNNESKSCYVAVLSDNGTWTAGIVKDGESGYYKTGWDWKATREIADELCQGLNKRLGLNEKEVMEMTIKSMRGVSQ